MHEDSLFSTSLPTLISCMLGNSHYNMCNTSHCGFNLHFPDVTISDVEHIGYPICWSVVVHDDL